MKKHASPLAAPATADNATPPAAVPAATPCTGQPVLGLDLAQKSFVAALRQPTGPILVAEFLNSAAGFRRLSRWLAQHLSAGAAAGLEATGIYAQALAHDLHVRGHRVHLLNPARVAAYARSQGQRNKTDPADARLIAQYVATHTLPVWTLPPPERLALQGLTRLRQQLSAHRQQIKNQLHSAAEALHGHLEKVLTVIEAEMKALQEKIAAHLRTHAALGAAATRLETIPGLGPLTAAIVLAELPEVTAQSDPRALAAWCALVPGRRQSGPREYRTCMPRTGNMHLRQALHMPALVAKRHNPLLRAFAERLAKNGKRPGAIVGAVAHKLLRIIIGLLRHSHDFDPNHPQKK